VAGRGKAGTDAVAALEDALAARAAAHEARDRAGYVAADAAFHRGVVVASGNPLLLRLFDAVQGVIHRSIEETAVFPENPDVRDAHAAIVRAVRAGDADGAVAASYGLIDGVKESM
jgi:DNA-binding FadR family transcriptional regulator